MATVSFIIYTDLNDHIFSKYFQKYEKPRFSERSVTELYSKSKKVFNSQQMSALKGIYSWRDKMARTEDESIGCVYQATLTIFLVHDSSDGPTMCPTRKRNSHLCFFVFFFLRHAKKWWIFFYQISSISVKKWAKSANNFRWEKKSDLWNFFFFFFPPTWLKNPCRDLCTKEYSGCCLSSAVACALRSLSLPYP